MGGVLRNWRVVGAALCSLLLVVGAYLLARSTSHPPRVEASEETDLLRAIATKDSDGDGLPDWEESLYGTDPQQADSKGLGMTDGEAVAKGLIVPVAAATVPVATSTPTSQGADGLPPPPAEGTLTSAFAQSFFTLYVQAKERADGADLSDAELQQVATQAIQNLASTIRLAPDFKQPSDLIVSGSGTEALKKFAVDAENVLLSSTANATTSELAYLRSALIEHDTSALERVRDIAAAYRKGAIGLAVLPVPAEAGSADVALMNAFMRMSEIIGDLTHTEDDPLLAILALQQYPQAVQKLGDAFVGFSSVYARMGIVFPQGTPGSQLVNLATDLRAASSTP